MNAYELYMDFLFSKAGKRGIPLSGTFELTSRCNLDCKMCYIHRRANDRTALSQELPAEFWIDLANQCKSAGMLHLLLTGGEPLLRHDFEKIYTACRKMGLLVSVNSNATMITDRILDLFSELPPARVNITLYGASSDTYGQLCGDASAYQKTVNAIKALKNANILVKLNCSTTQYNLQDINHIFQFAKDHNLQIQNATYMYPPVRACEHVYTDASRLTPEESARAQIAYDMLRLPEEDLQKRWKQQLDGIRVTDETTSCQDLPAATISCRAGLSTFWVTWDGNLRPCGMMTSPSVDVKKNTFLSAWNDLGKAREEIYLPTQCVQCDIRNVCDQCPAICQAESGDFSISPEYMCKRTKAYLCLIEEAIKKA